jgi:hypothetical protein
MLYSTIEEAWSRPTLEGFQGGSDTNNNTTCSDSECTELIKKILQCKGCKDKAAKMFGPKNTLFTTLLDTWKKIEHYELDNQVKDKLQTFLLFCAAILVIMILLEL